MLLINEKEITIDTCKKMDDSQNNYALWSKPDKKYILY